MFTFYFFLHISVPLLSLQEWSSNRKKNRPLQPRIEFKIVCQIFYRLNVTMPKFYIVQH